MTLTLILALSRTTAALPGALRTGWWRGERGEAGERKAAEGARAGSSLLLTISLCLPYISPISPPCLRRFKLLLIERRRAYQAVLQDGGVECRGRPCKRRANPLAHASRPPLPLLLPSSPPPLPSRPPAACTVTAWLTTVAASRTCGCNPPRPRLQFAVAGTTPSCRAACHSCARSCCTTTPRRRANRVRLRFRVRVRALVYLLYHPTLTPTPDLL